MPVSLSLPQRWSTELKPVAPFNFDATLHKPDHFPAGDNRWQPGIRWQTMRWRDEPLGLKYENCGSLGRPRIKLSVWSQARLPRAFRADLVAELTYRCNLSLKLAEFYRDLRTDPQLGPVVRRWRGLRPACQNSLYEYLVIAIVLQNATVRRSVNMLQALFDRYGTRLAYAGQVLDCFWPPATLAQAAEADLRALKVGYRAKALGRVSAAFGPGGLNEEALRQQPLEGQRATLLNLYGVGPASVGYILFDVFHQFGELSYISPWEQKIYSKLFLGRSPARPAPVAHLLKRFERYGAYKMLAVHYAWEDLFWQRTTNPPAWLETLIRL